jgi:CheY-like chemotaxis protein
MVLVVDDQEDVRATVAESLEAAGYEVLQAADGPAALAILGQRQDVRLLVTDIRMPLMSGTELARRAVALHPGIGVVLMSGYFPPLATIGRVLHKPFDTRQLLAAVRAGLAAGGAG